MWYPGKRYTLIKRGGEVNRAHPEPLSIWQARELKEKCRGFYSFHNLYSYEIVSIHRALKMGFSREELGLNG